MKPKIKQYYKREWLNSKHGRAFIITRASVSDEAVYAELDLSDCHEEISLDFNAYDLKSIPEKLKKIDKIRKALDEIEDKLLEGVATMFTREEWKEIKQARKAEEGEDHAALTYRLDL